MQKSVREGFGRHGVTGFLVHSADGCANRIAQLLEHPGESVVHLA
jgi:hypothetical protein